MTVLHDECRHVNRKGSIREVFMHVEQNRKIFMDESGFTGSDLLNSDQPFQVLTSVWISEEEAKNLADRFFPGHRGRELKYSALRRRDKNWEPLLGLQRVLLEEYSGKSFIAHKRFCSVLKLVDLCIEPVWNDRGENLYYRGQHMALANVLFAAAPALCGQAAFWTLIESFQQAIRTKNYGDFESFIRMIKGLPPNAIRDELEIIVTNEMFIYKEIISPMVTTDMSLSILMALMFKIEEEHKHSYSIVHDSSKNFDSYRKGLHYLQSVDQSRGFFVTDLAKIQFPLKLSTIEEGNSNSSFGIQMADILAGALNEAARAQCGLVEENELNRQSIGVYGDDNLLFLFPSCDFDEIEQGFDGAEAKQFIDFLSRQSAEET